MHTSITLPTFLAILLALKTPLPNKPFRLLPIITSLMTNATITIKNRLHALKTQSSRLWQINPNHRRNPQIQDPKKQKRRPAQVP